MSISFNFEFITPNNVLLLVDDLLDLEKEAFLPALINWSERLIAGLLDSLREYGYLLKYKDKLASFWGLSQQAAVADNLNWLACEAKALCQILKPSVRDELLVKWINDGVLTFDEFQAATYYRK
jgi:hypothetical protein